LLARDAIQREAREGLRERERDRHGHEEREPRECDAERPQRDDRPAGRTPSARARARVPTRRASSG
jgi:hypothetical protein